MSAACALARVRDQALFLVDTQGLIASRNAGARLIPGCKADDPDAGAQVMAASGANEARALLRQRKPAVIVSDPGMPGCNGYDFMRPVRQFSDADSGCIPAAAVSAYLQLQDQQQALAAGSQKHLVKPVEPYTLIVAVAKLANGALPTSTAGAERCGGLPVGQPPPVQPPPVSPRQANPADQTMPSKCRCARATSSP